MRWFWFHHPTSCMVTGMKSRCLNRTRNNWSNRLLSTNRATTISSTPPKTSKSFTTQPMTTTTTTTTCKRGVANGRNGNLDRTCTFCRPATTSQFSRAISLEFTRYMAHAPVWCTRRRVRRKLASHLLLGGPVSIVPVVEWNLGPHKWPPSGDKKAHKIRDRNKKIKKVKTIRYTHNRWASWDMAVGNRANLMELSTTRIYHRSLHWNRMRAMRSIRNQLALKRNQGKELTTWLSNLIGLKSSWHWRTWKLELKADSSFRF